MATTPPTFRSPDTEHLKLLEIFHYVLAGFSALGIGFLFVHYAIMSTVFTNPHMLEQMRKQQEQQNAAPFDPALFIHAFIYFYLFMGGLFLVVGLLNLASGLFLRNRRNRTFSLVTGGINCVFFPFGTVLGIFTIIILIRPSVKALYGEPA